MENEIIVRWQKRPVMPERLLAVWIQGWDQGYDYLPGDSTESVFNSPDYCEQHELTLIEWYSSGKRVYLGQIKINTSKVLSPIESFCKRLASVGVI